MENEKNIVWQSGGADSELRRGKLGFFGMVVWFTGLSGSGKSTVACALERELVSRGIPAYLLDGDNLRHGLNADLGFDNASRGENIRRIAEVAALFEDAGLIAIVSAISPLEASRAFAESRAKRFLTVYMDADIETCIKRDPKGLYKKALAGEIKNYTGIDSPYEVPSAPDIILDTRTESVEKCTEKCLKKILEIVGGG